MIKLLNGPVADCDTFFVSFWVQSSTILTFFLAPKIKGVIFSSTTITIQKRNEKPIFQSVYHLQLILLQSFGY